MPATTFRSPTARKRTAATQSAAASAKASAKTSDKTDSAAPKVKAATTTRRKAVAQPSVGTTADLPTFSTNAASKPVAPTTTKAAGARKATAKNATRSTVTNPTPPAPAAAKRSAIAKAKRMAPSIPAQIGSTPRTLFRGNPDIFGRLVEDHDHHRALLAMITATHSDSAERKKLFKELVKELKSHAAAEEQALWSSVMRHPPTTADARHAVGEHKEIDKMLDDLAARDMASGGWLRRFAALHKEYLHHIKEEEQEQFVAAQRHLTPGDIRYMKQVFNRRKREEKEAAKVVKKIRKAD